ncbi:hypothetical protein HXX76_014657 [Chlamydomonas incerta]|uniref:ceramidase n=1 Tax=Chlamydomonas incerta TaxID=51695 RepID=A0A835SL14_CHLIN|nr:hypothetical protein HXX76_014657 [Chlamydomonas incerta]|eukprot:KAG2424279.1 hypothetical protein HXX76_014657 [Chlamydomonas incerta]
MALGRPAALLLLVAASMSCYCCTAEYLVGVGTGDITGPVADVNLMGYAQPLQTARGLHTRLAARAFMFAEAADPSRRFVYVSADACMASQLVSLRVVQALQAEYGSELYGFDNVAISGTHTHASPAGFLQYLLYDITSLGFVTQSFDAMVDGILAAIRAAHASLQPGRVSLAAGQLAGASINRSPTAYAANPPEERALYDSDVDTDMVLLRLEAEADAAVAAGPAAVAAGGAVAGGTSGAAAGEASGEAAAGAGGGAGGHPLGLGALGWFAVHCTSLNNTNRLVSGDNKAAASLLLERWAAEAEARASAAAAAEAGASGAKETAAEAVDSGGAAGAGESQQGRGQAAWAAAQSAAAAAAAASAALGLRLGDITSPQPELAAAAAGGRAAQPFAFRLRGASESGGAGGAGSAGNSGSGSSSGSSSSSGDGGGGASAGGGGGGAGGGGAPQRFSRGFVAAVAQAAVGDTSPNTAGAYCLDTGLPCEPEHSTCNGRNELCHGRGPAWPDDRASAALIGGRQAEAARRLYLAAAAQAPLAGPLAYRSSFLDMANVTVAPVTDGPGGWRPRGGRTCPAAMGMSFAAGTTDGPGAFDFTQGDTKGPPLWRLVARLVAAPSAQQVACQAPKPILLDTGQITVPYAWQPRITQVSLLRLGRLLIACLPGEPTTMAGRRIKRALAARFAAAAGPGQPPPVVVVSGLTGTYSSYITTWEEYQVQRYEGASTLYGPHTLDAYIQELLALADSMLSGSPHDPTAGGEVRPPDLQAAQWGLLPPVVLDAVPPGALFGQVTQQPGRASYAPGQVVNATFRAANPRNNLHTNGSFMAVERWQPAANRRPRYANGQAVAAAAGQGLVTGALNMLRASGAQLWRLLRKAAQLPAASGAGSAAQSGSSSSSSSSSSSGSHAGLTGAGAAAAAAKEAAAANAADAEVGFAAQSACDQQGPLLRAAAVAAAAAEGAAGLEAGEEGGEGEWVVVHDDRDWVTRFQLDRPAELSPLSYATLVWEVPAGTPPGAYRLRYRGDAKTLSGAVRPFEGCSAAFRVEAAATAEEDGGERQKLPQQPAG